MHPIRFVFPSYTAAVAQTRAHGEDGFAFARRAYQSPELAKRLDDASRAVNSFDHSISATEKLPLSKVVPNLATYRAGYKSAKLAVNLLVGSGLIPGARQRVGKQELFAVRDEVNAGLSALTADKSRYGRYRALDWIDASIEDAGTGVLMLRKPTLALPLLNGLKDVRNSVSRAALPKAETLKQINDALDAATADLQLQIDDAAANPVAKADAMVRRADTELAAFSDSTKPSSVPTTRSAA
jgi:hypothetical protein